MVDVENRQLKQQLSAAQQNSINWQTRYRDLRNEVQPYLDAMRHAPERVRNFKESRLYKPCAETPLIWANVQTVCRKCAAAFLHKKKKKKRQILRFDVQYLVHLQGLEPWAH